MKFLVLLSTLGCALAVPAKLDAAAAAQTPPVHGPWTGPVAATVGAGVNGLIIPVSDTLEVQNAILAFNQEYNAALRRNGHLPVFPPLAPRWTGPFATIIPAGLPRAGDVDETAEVKAAKAAFAQAYAAAVLANTPPAAKNAPAEAEAA